MLATHLPPALRGEGRAEVAHFWNKLLEGGKAEQCGWLKDRYGVSWQIVPTVLGEMMKDRWSRADLAA